MTLGEKSVQTNNKLHQISYSKERNLMQSCQEQLNNI